MASLLRVGSKMKTPNTNPTLNQSMNPSNKQTNKQQTYKMKPAAAPISESPGRKAHNCHLSSIHTLSGCLANVEISHTCARHAPSLKSPSFEFLHEFLFFLFRLSCSDAFDMQKVVQHGINIIPCNMHTHMHGCNGCTYSHSHTHSLAGWGVV